MSILVPELVQCGESFILHFHYATCIRIMYPEKNFKSNNLVSFQTSIFFYESFMETELKIVYVNLPMQINSDSNTQNAVARLFPGAVFVIVNGEQ